MGEGPPPPVDSVAPLTGAPPKRPRTDSDASTSIKSIRSVRTLSEDDLEYVHENDRTYGNDTYYLPCVYMPNNDYEEQDRLSLQHQIFVHALQGRLTTTRLLPSTRRILDLGTGPGHWAVAMANQYPHAEVVGIDMTSWDLNTTSATVGDSCVTWELDDLDVWGCGEDSVFDDLVNHFSSLDFAAAMSHRNPLESSRSRARTFKTGPGHSSGSQPDNSVEYLSIDLSTLQPQPEPGWHFSAPFEFIHLRNMKGAFADWEAVYAEIYKSLSPGGWIEVADYDLGQMPISPQDHESGRSTFPALRKVYAKLMEASFKSGRPLGLYYMHSSYLEEAGFEDIQTTHVNVPVGQWAEDEAQRSVGKKMLVIVMESLETSLLRLMTKWGDRERVWTAEEVRRQVEEVQGEISDWVERSERGEVEGWCARFKWITARKSWHAET
ncbi:S-adenosyl-L-methionine-dependent methyltransferase [Clathrospora elynae]|uniref:S-adenosyl-L-methionine-dependent methyltransferase n=1 Tax=Clathrospora elynae TaxID=706981 RepID=A0A6A5SIS6_9PLEO|nr:S-adenosyl-L-methionine-dependent methyltransferase [Clathrospora elynae]